MISINEPPPPLAASTSLSTLQTKLSTHNIITASNTLLDLIRMMKMSALVMDGEQIYREEDVECWENDIVKHFIHQQEILLEKEYFDLTKKEEINRWMNIILQKHDDTNM